MHNPREKIPNLATAGVWHGGGSRSGRQDTKAPFRDDCATRK